MLTRIARGLERDGLISRTVHPTVPPQVEYTLTEVGHKPWSSGPAPIAKTSSQPVRATTPPSTRATPCRHLSQQIFSDKIGAQIGDHFWS